MQAIVVRLSELTFLSSEDLSGACSEAELGEKIIKQFAFLTGDIRVTITDGTARIEYRQPATEKISEAQRLSEQAAQKAKSGDFPQALDLFTQALAANPALPVTRRDLAMLHYELGDLSAAKDQLIDALRLAPDDAWSYVVLGNIFTREQDWDSAIRFFTKALDLKPGDPYALNGLGAASAKSGDEASAMRHFEAAIEANPHFPEPRFGKALLLKNQGHLDAAAEALESLLRDASPADARSNPEFQRAEQLLASIRKEIRERGGPTNPELLQEKHPAAVWHLLDALKRFENLDVRRVGEITFEIARLRGKPLTETQRHGEKFLPTALPSPSSPCFQLSAFSISAFSFVPHVCRIQTHRSRSGYRNGFERALALSTWVV
jgi:tetratricopeptide (TPR) repeat protein